MRAKKLPSGNWRVRVSIKKDDGKYSTKSFTAPTRKEAEYLATSFLAGTGSSNDENILIGDAMKSYIDSHRSVASPSTVREWLKMERLYYDDVKKMRVSDFATADAQAFINRLSARLSPKSVRNIYGFLSTVIRYSDDEKVLRPQLPKKEKPQFHTPTDEEVKALIDSADPELKIAICLASVGTLRRGEICGLSYSDIKENFIHVHRVKVQDENKEWVIKEIPKTEDSDRWVELPVEIIDLLGSGEGYIMSINPDRITNRFCKLRDRLEIRTRFHDLRHYSASIMHALGVPDQYIMERGGWRSDTILKQVYRNVLEDKRNAFVDKTNDYLTDKLFATNFATKNEKP